jgi:putative transposase
LLVDTLGMVLAVAVTAASVQDRDGAVPVLREASREYPSLERVWVDGAYNGAVIDRLREQSSFEIEVVKRNDDIRGFTVLPKRWIGERTLGWFNRFRLLSKEYERTIESSRADILHASSTLMLRRLTTSPESRLDAR